MALTIKSRAEIIQDLENAIKARDPAIETGFGPVKDIVIDPVSLAARDLYTQVKRTFDASKLINADNLTIEELDLLGESLGIKRRGPVRATGSVFFLTSNKPSNDILIPAGIPVATATLAGISEVQPFVTSKSVTLFAASADAFFNPASGFFEIEAPIVALNPGAKGLVASSTIRTLQRPIPGISSVTNKSSTFGGKDQETNIDYARRIGLALVGIERGTENGLKRFSLVDERVIDSLVVPPGDPLMKRGETVAGAVDVYILGEEPTVDLQTEIFNGLDIAFENEPLIFPNPVTRVVKSGTTLLTEGVHYFVITDPVLDGSTAARNLLRWNRSAGGLPVDGDSISIEFIYDKLIQDLQNNLDKQENDVLADVLFRKSTLVNVALTATLKITSEFSVDDVTSRVRSEIKSFVNTRGLGEDIVPSDLDVVIRSVAGVDFVFLPFDLLAKVGDSGSNIIPIAKNEFAQIDDANITLNVSL